jgi:hypothetical protein
MTDKFGYFNVGCTKTVISAHVFTSEYNGNYILTVNYLVLLNTFDMTINDTTAVIIQYQINTHISNYVV